MTAFAGRPGIEVLPTCTMERIGTSFKIASKDALAFWNSTAQAALWGSIVTFIVAARVSA
jgi:hypothetical protein